MLQNFVMTFVPLFIVIDAIGVMPFLISIEHETGPGGRLKMINTAIITATAVGLVFLFFGQFILDMMNISVGSFAIAGGLILLIFSIKYMTTGHMVDVIKEEMVAVVPIGTPLTAGPATITTLLLLSDAVSIMDSAGVLCPEYGRRLGYIHVGEPDRPLPGAGRSARLLPGVQPAAYSHRREHDNKRANPAGYNLKLGRLIVSP